MHSVYDVLPFWLVSDCAIRKLGVSRSLTLPWQANMGYEKYSLHVIFTFYLDRDTSVLELFPVIEFKQKRFSVLTHLHVYCSRLIRNVRSRQHMDNSSIIAYPVKTAEEIIKMWCQELYIYIYHPLDNQYGFSISVQSEISPLSTVSVQC